MEAGETPGKKGEKGMVRIESNDYFEGAYRILNDKGQVRVIETNDGLYYSTYDILNMLNVKNPGKWFCNERNVRGREYDTVKLLYPADFVSERKTNVSFASGSEAARIVDNCRSSDILKKTVRKDIFGDDRKQATDTALPDVKQGKLKTVDEGLVVEKGEISIIGESVWKVGCFAYEGKYYFSVGDIIRNFSRWNRNPEWWLKENGKNLKWEVVKVRYVSVNGTQGFYEDYFVDRENVAKIAARYSDKGNFKKFLVNEVLSVKDKCPENQEATEERREPVPAKAEAPATHEDLSAEIDRIIFEILDLKKKISAM